MMEYKLIPEEDLTKEDLLKVVKSYEEKTEDLEYHLKVAESISEFDIKLSILKTIQKYEKEGEENIVKALQDLSLDIYMYPPDIFEVTPIDDLIETVKQHKKNFFENVLIVRVKDELMKASEE